MPGCIGLGRNLGEIKRRSSCDNTAIATALVEHSNNLVMEAYNFASNPTDQSTLVFDRNWQFDLQGLESTVELTGQTKLESNWTASDQWRNLTYLRGNLSVDGQDEVSACYTKALKDIMIGKLNFGGVKQPPLICRVQRTENEDGHNIKIFGAQHLTNGLKNQFEYVCRIDSQGHLGEMRGSEKFSSGKEKKYYYSFGNDTAPSLCQEQKMIRPDR